MRFCLLLLFVCVCVCARARASVRAVNVCKWGGGGVSAFKFVFPCFIVCVRFADLSHRNVTYPLLEVRATLPDLNTVTITKQR